MQSTGNPGEAPGRPPSSSHNTFDSNESTPPQVPNESSSSRRPSNGDISDVEAGRQSGRSSGKPTSNSETSATTDSVEVVCGSGDAQHDFPSTNTARTTATEGKGLGEDEKIHPSESPRLETKDGSDTTGPLTEKSLSSSVFSRSFNSFASASDLREKNRAKEKVRTHSVLLNKDDSRQVAQEPSSCQDTTKALACSPMAAAFVLVVIIGVVVTEVAVTRVQEDFEERFVSRLDQEVRETGRVARRQMLFLTESHSLFAKTFEGEIVERASREDAGFFTSGLWPGFSSGGKYLLEIIHGHVSGGVIWVPRILHEQRDEFETELQHMTGSNCSIWEANPSVEYTASYDFSTLSFNRSSNKSVYYPIAGKVWDRGNDEIDVSHRNPLFNTMVDGLDLSSLTTSGEFKETFDSAKNTGRAQSSVPIRFGSTTYVIVSVPVFSCRRTSELWSDAACEEDSFRGIVGLFLDGDAVVSSVFNIMKTVSSVDEIAMFTEDITNVNNFNGVDLKSFASQEELVPVKWHGEEWGRGRFVKGYADSLWYPVEDSVETETLLSASGDDGGKKQAFVIDDADIASEANQRFSLDGISYEHSFLLNIGGRVYNIKHVLLPSSVDSIEDSLDNPTVAARIAGYIGTVAVAVFASLGLFLYQHRRDRMLQAARESVGQLQAAQEAHKRTIGFAQHELRNPLHVILSSGKEVRDILENNTSCKYGTESDLYRTFREEIDRVVDHSEIMERLVNDMNDLHKLDEGQLDLNPEPVTLTRFVESMAHWHRSFAEVPLYGETSPVIGDRRMSVDPLRLRQIIANGLTNSGKYCNSGCIHLYCGGVVADDLESAVKQIPSQIKMAWDEKGYIRFRNKAPGFETTAYKWIVFRVADTGEGLGGLTARELFEPFTQGVYKPVRKRAPQLGTGQPVTEANDRREGTNVEAETKAETEKKYKEDGNALCRGQSDASYQGPDEMSRTIRGTGLGLPLAKSLTEALQGSIDLRDEEIPCTKGGRKHVTVFEMIIPFVACTETPVQEESVVETNSAYHLFEDREAFRALRHTLQNRARPVVCVVDDASTNISVAKRCFKPLENKVVALNDGDEVIPYLQSSGQLSSDSGDRTDTLNDPFSSADELDILFVDISMRRMGGDSLCHELRNKWDFRLPIIAMTGNTSPGEVEHYRQLGFSGVVAKPFGKKNIKGLMETLINASMAVDQRYSS
eukprot:gb/GECG01016517.1/.p1 GENE.gb/GECG01016517.1/~~gb/GECG01016517.1/.p1  ORF type:complete len:1201 (+),score=177.42 gb/GECG01016517.1/:1-3603(+)